MQGVRTLPAVRRYAPLWPHLARLAVAVGIALNLVLIVQSVGVNIGDPPDWRIWSEVPERLRDGTLYADKFRWSPAIAFAWLAIVPLGFGVFAVAHFAVLPLLGWRLALLTVTFWGFWVDVSAGNAFTFVFVAAVLGWRGNRWGELAYLALTLLIPRPIQVPLLLWLLWKRPHTRMPFALMFGAHVVVVALSGYGMDWIERLLLTPEHQIGTIPFPANGSPSAFIGAWWLLIGVPLGMWLLRRGRVGLASLAVSPYLLPYYWMMGFLELRQQGPPQPVQLALTEIGVEHGDVVNRSQKLAASGWPSPHHEVPTRRRIQVTAQVPHRNGLAV